MLLGPPGTKSPCKVHGSREKCHWGGRSPGPERVPGAHELLPHQVGGPGFKLIYNLDHIIFKYVYGLVCNIVDLRL